ncbi:MAG: CMP/dCMP deaminase zinc-binding protein [Chitinophagaceae bacterium]|nr:CMP/dCMP deaminase zinc-binding protein [Chitinophagaceae bacterium]
MKKEELKFTIDVYESSDELNEDDAFLLSEARSVTQFAYAPYSNFQVGAVAKLVNGEIVSGTNQENASYPAGICAERSLLSTAASNHPGVAIETMAVTYNNLKGDSDAPVSPCGICRQVISEFQNRFQKPIRIILSGMKGKVQVIDNAGYLLPLAFTSEDLK